jgi:transposase
MSKEYSQYVGIDVAANSFTAAWGTGEGKIRPATEFEQKQADYRRLVAKLKATGHKPTWTLVVLEATGTYWMHLALALHEAGFQVSVINPRQAYHYAQARLQQAKTDAIDARLLAELAASLEVKLWQPPSEAWEALYQRLVEHDNLVEMRQMLRNQLHALKRRTHLDPQVEARKQALLDQTNAQLKQIDRELKDWLHRSEWTEEAVLLRSIKGIGLLGTAWLLVVTQGFTTCEDAEQLAAYLGLVPHPQQSGNNRKGHKPTGHSGHARARRVLYQASISAARFNLPVRTFYNRLRAAGKPTKVARVAATRKLVHIAFAIVSKGQPFDPQYHLSIQQSASIP